MTQKLEKEKQKVMQSLPRDPRVLQQDPRKVEFEDGIRLTQGTFGGLVSKE